MRCGICVICKKPGCKVLLYPDDTRCVFHLCPHCTVSFDAWVDANGIYSRAIVHKEVRV